MWETDVTGINDIKLVDVKWKDDLEGYLKFHESDIAHKINDYGQLRLVWDMFFPEPPKP